MLTNWDEWLERHEIKPKSIEEKFEVICKTHKTCGEECPFYSIEGACDWTNPLIEEWLNAPYKPQESEDKE